MKADFDITAGHCVAEAGFYVHDNYYRSLQASAILAALIVCHCDSKIVLFARITLFYLNSTPIQTSAWSSRCRRTSLFPQYTVPN